MRPRFSAPLLALLCLLGGQALFAQAAKPASPGPGPRPAGAARGDTASGTLARADGHYGRQSYALALRAYRQAIAARQVPPAQRPLVDYRIARCLGFTEQWDAALAETQKVAQRYPGGLWDARSRSWLMQLYLRVPHAVWKVGNRYYRGEDAPEVDGDAEPEQLYLEEDDRTKAITYGEQSKALYEKLRQGRADLGPEEADLSVDVARLVSAVLLPPWAEARRWSSPADPQWKLDPAAPYERGWAPPKKVLHLYLSAEQTGNAGQKAPARLAQATWLRGYQAHMRQAAREDHPEGQGKAIPYPYQGRLALDVLRSLSKDFPTHPEGQRARLTAATWLAEDGKFVQAVQGLQAFQKELPQNRWAPSARAAELQITRLRLQVAPPPPQPPGQKAQLHVDARNVKRLKLTAYRVKLEEMVRDARVIGRAQGGVDGLLTWLGKRPGVAKFYQGDPESWTVDLTDRDDYVPVSRAIETPLTRTGAYVVEADGGAVRAAVLLVVSDLAVIQMMENERVLAFVVNAQTGAPVAEASAMIREVFRESDGKEEKLRVSAITGKTDEEGLAEKARPARRLASQGASTFAWKGERYAFTPGVATATLWTPPSGDPGERRRAYVYTERPVYRPAQAVHYRALLTTRKGEDPWQPAVGAAVTVGVFDPQGSQIARQPAVAGEFGSVAGSIELPSEAPLGLYRVGVWTGDGKDAESYGQGQFRVEEYKKPEFAVTVQGPARPGRVGDKLQVRVTARYYFGAPVPGAKLKYSVIRREWFPANPVPRPYADLYRAEDAHSMPRWWDPDWTPIPEQTGEGELVTNAAGEAIVELDARLDDPRFKGRHLELAVHVDVTDASRRTISDDAQVRALSTDFNTFLSLRQRFYAAGDRLQADIRALDAEGRPVAAKGLVRVLSLTAKEAPRGETARYESREVHSEPAATDAEGRAVFAWPAAQAGAYEIRFEARDSREALVVARARAWVAGEGAGTGVFHHDHLQLIAAQSTYRIGERGRLLLVGDEPNLSALLTFEAGGRILERRVVRLEGRSRVIDLPIRKTHSPDVVVRATGVRDRELFQAEVHLYVPPAEQLLSMEVAAERSVYRPGEKAVFHIRAHDADGKPVRTEASLGIVDASVFYIQGDLAGAIGAHFYAEERGSSLRAAGSTDSLFAPLAEDDQPPPKSPDIAWEPPRLGNLPPDAIYDRLATDQNGLLRFSLDGSLAVPRSVAAGSEAAAPMEQARKQDEGKGGEGGALPNVRSNFADTAFWTPAVITDARGEARVEMTWPDNLTQWRATTKGWTTGVQVGEAFTDVTTSKDLLVRLQAPRFFMERDEAVLSANVHNYTQADRRVRVRLHLEGDTLYSAASTPLGPPRPRPLFVPRPDRPEPAAAGKPGDDPAADEAFDQWIDVPAGSERRLDWRVRVERPGEAKVRVTAEAGPDSDGVELAFPVYTHGVEKLLVKTGALLMAPGEKPGTKSAQITLNLPVERATDSGSLVVQVSPSLAATMLDALPYLVDYPYGCVEQTMSRFLPSVLCAKTLTDLGVNLETLRFRAEAEHRRILGEAAKDRPTTSGYTYPEGAPGLRDLRRIQAEQWAWRAQKSPVYRPEMLKKMVAEGLDRLRRFQNTDGSWGWWRQDAGDPHMTAYVAQGLITGKAAGMEPPGAMLTRALTFLDGAFKKETDANEVAYLGAVLSLDPARVKAVRPILLERGFQRRDRLAAYGLAVLALALRQVGQPNEAAVCLQNLENTARVDAAAGTCSWSRGAGRAWDWQNDPVETAAAALRAFNKLAPRHRLAPMIVRWLVNRRGGDAWDSTRATAMAVQALAEYVRGNRELAPDYQLTIETAGFKQTLKVNAENALLFDNRFVVPAPALGNGPQTITFQRQGQGNVYYAAYLRYFTLEEGIQPVGTDLRVRRRYYRLTRPEGGRPPKDAPTTADGYLRTQMRPGQRLTSGDLVDVELLIESKNDYSHLVFEDMKPAGCEPVDLRSGDRYGSGLCSNMELRDEKVAFFISHLPQGRRLLSYRVRAEIPGAFHALPVNGYAMYAPEVRCLSEETLVGIEDAPARMAAAVRRKALSTR